RSEVASGDAGPDIEQSVSRLSADQQVVVRHELGTGVALVVEGALHMGLDLAAQREGVPRGEVPLELRDDRQLRVTGGRVGRRTSRGRERRWGARERQRLATGVDIETEVLGELGIELGRSQAQGESLDGGPFQLLLRALDARRACVADDREGVLTQEPELEVLPVLPEECTVEPQVVVQPARLEAEFVVGQIIGLVRGERRLRRYLNWAVDATVPE